MITSSDAIRAARALLGTPYAQLDCINLIKAVIRRAPGGVPSYTTAGTNALWRSYTASPKYRDLTWRQTGLAGAKAGMLAFKASGADVHHVGLVTGEGTVVHSSSAQGGRGVAETPLTAAEGWTHLAVHRYITPSEEKEESPMEETLCTARVATKSGPLNLRAADAPDAPVIAQIPRGTQVGVVRLGDARWRIVYDGLTGYAAAQYLRPSGCPDTPAAPDAPDAPSPGQPSPGQPSPGQPSPDDFFDALDAAEVYTALYCEDDGQTIALLGRWRIARD